MPGKLLALTNGTFITTDRIDKRNGYTALTRSITPSGSIAAAVGLSAYKSELTLANGLNLYSYSPDKTAWKAVTGALKPVGVADHPVYQSSASQTTVDAAYHAGSGLQCFVSTSTFGISSSNQVVYTVVDSTTGVEIVSGGIVPGTTSANPVAKVLAFQGYFVIIYAISGTTNLKYCTIDVTTPTVISAAVSLATDLVAAHQTFDAAVINARLFVTYNATGGVDLFYLDASLVKSSVSQYAGDQANGCITVFGDASNNAWIAYYNDSTHICYVAVRDYALSTPVLAPTALFSTSTLFFNITGVIVSGSSPAKAQIFAEIDNTYQHRIITGTMTTAGTAVNSGTILFNYGLAGKAFTYGSDTSNIYVLATYQGTAVQLAPQQTYFLINQSGGAVAKIMQNTGAGYVTRHLSEVNTLATGTYHYGLGQVSATGVFGGLNYNIYGASSATVTFGATAAEVELANSLHVTGGFLSVYDGGQVAEHGFHVYPEIANLSSTGTGLTGTYSYVVCYEWTDNQGQTHRSAPSLPQTITVTNKSIALVITTLALTAKTSTISPAGAVTIGIYRTLNAGTIYYRVTDVLGPVANNTATDVITFTDNVTDATIQANGFVYTTDGEVENVPVPAPLFLTSYKQRMVVVPAESPTSWWFSKQIIPGSPVEFSDSFVQNEDQRGGAFTAGGQLDDKLILFKTNTLGYVVGDGPAANGTANDFTPWQIVQSDTGCNNAASVIGMPDGLMYQSPKGIYLLDRSMKDHYIGADVEAYNSYTVTSAQRVTGTTQVRFTLSNGTALVYDYADTVKDERGYGQWSVFTNIAAVASTIYGGSFTYVTSAGLVLKEAAGVYTDNGTGIQLSLTTSWLSLAGLQGFQRVYGMALLGQYQSAHTLQVTVAYDFDSTVMQTNAITATSTPPYEYEINLRRQKCTAVQFVIQDTAPTGQSMSLSAISLEVGIKSGQNRLAPTRSFG